MLRNAAESKCSEFVAVYGRRRVGKTFLVRETFNSNFTFQHSGVANSGTKIQLERFRRSLIESGHARCPALKTWFQAFDELKTVVVSSNMGKKVLFIDEMPWMDKPNANFIPALENFWNAWASARKDVLLIVCGSATSWMLNKVIHGRGGLHNRVTVRIPLRPFCLSECEELAASMGLEATRYQLVQYYMALGGVAYYWSQLAKGMSAEQNINRLFFSKDEGLRGEFEELYSSLFRNPQPYEQIIRSLGKRRYGLTRDEILSDVGKESGGDMTRYLEELEECGFIRSYHVVGAVKRGKLYQLIDNFSLFHMQFSGVHGSDDGNYWTAFVPEGTKHAWRGLAFERLCLSHVRQIKETLGISGVAVDVYAWRRKGTERGDAGVQIDLLLDRKDGIINLCEMKYSEGEYVLDHAELERMISRRETFRSACGTKKAIHLTLVTSNGLRHNKYSGNIQSELALADLFRE